MVQASALQKIQIPAPSSSPPSHRPRDRPRRFAQTVQLGKLILHLERLWDHYDVPAWHRHLYKERYCAGNYQAEVLLKEAKALASGHSKVRIAQLAIGRRADMLIRLSLVRQTFSDLDFAASGSLARTQLSEQLHELRIATIDAILAVCDWRLFVAPSIGRTSVGGPGSRGARWPYQRDEVSWDDYLLYLARDDADVRSFSEVLQLSPDCDPLLLHCAVGGIGPNQSGKLCPPSFDSVVSDRLETARVRLLEEELSFTIFAPANLHLELTLEREKPERTPTGEDRLVSADPAHVSQGGSRLLRELASPLQLPPMLCSSDVPYGALHTFKRRARCKQPNLPQRPQTGRARPFPWSIKESQPCRPHSAIGFARPDSKLSNSSWKVPERDNMDGPNNLTPASSYNPHELEKCVPFSRDEAVCENDGQDSMPIASDRQEIPDSLQSPSIQDIGKNERVNDTLPNDSDLQHETVGTRFNRDKIPSAHEQCARDLVHQSFGDRVAVADTKHAVCKASDRMSRQNSARSESEPDPQFDMPRVKTGSESSGIISRQISGRSTNSTNRIVDTPTGRQAASLISAHASGQSVTKGADVKPSSRKARNIVLRQNSDQSGSRVERKRNIGKAGMPRQTSSRSEAGDRMSRQISARSDAGNAMSRQISGLSDAGNGMSRQISGRSDRPARKRKDLIFQRGKGNQEGLLPGLAPKSTTLDALFGASGTHPGKDEHDLLLSPDNEEAKQQQQQPASGIGADRIMSSWHRFQHDNMLHHDDMQLAIQRLGFGSPNKFWLEEAFSSVTMFNAVSKDEFFSAVEHYAMKQRHAYEEEFKRYDQDRSGSLETAEFEEVLRGLGFEPMEHVLKECIDEVDEDSTGSLSFDEFYRVMMLLSEREGFTKGECLDMERTFKRFDEDGQGEVEVKVLPNILHYIGAQSTEEETKRVIAVIDLDGSGSIDFQEFLMCMRMFREHFLEMLKLDIARYDTDQAGTIDLQELMPLLQGRGYFADEGVIMQILTDIGLAPESPSELRLDLSGLWRFLVGFRQQEGLSKSDAMAVKEAFHKFCSLTERNEMEVPSSDLPQILRSLGYPKDLEDLKQITAQIDINRSGTLNEQGLMKLVRLCREGRFRTVEEEFRRADKEWLGTLSVLKGLEVLYKLGCIKRKLTFPPPVMAHELKDGTIDLTSFVKVARRMDERIRQQYRESGGYTEEELWTLRQKFSVYDEDGNGSVEKEELIKLLLQIFPDMATDRSKRPQLIGIIKQVDTDENGCLNFEEFAQLTRLVEDMGHTSQLIKERHVLLETNFSSDEVVDFRNIFLAKTEGSAALSFKGFKDMISPICPMGERNTHDLAELFATVVTDKEPNQPRLADFSDFLCLMRLVLDKNFGGVLQRIAPKSQ